MKSARLIPLLVCLCFSGLWVQATERTAVARSADAVVTGTLGAITVWPSLRGWRFSGRIRVTGTLRGLRIGDRIGYDFICSCCAWWPVPDLRQFHGRAGIWLLRRSGEYFSSAGNCADPGFREMWELESIRKAVQEPVEQRP